MHIKAGTEVVTEVVTEMPTNITEVVAYMLIKAGTEVEVVTVVKL